jgi:hypothetical protein
MKLFDIVWTGTSSTVTQLITAPTSFGRTRIEELCRKLGAQTVLSTEAVDVFNKLLLGYPVITEDEPSEAHSRSVIGPTAEKCVTKRQVDAMTRAVIHLRDNLVRVYAQARAVAEIIEHSKTRNVPIILDGIEVSSSIISSNKRGKFYRPLTEIPLDYSSKSAGAYRAMVLRSTIGHLLATYHSYSYIRTLCYHNRTVSCGIHMNSGYDEDTPLIRFNTIDIKLPAGFTVEQLRKCCVHELTSISTEVDRLLTVSPLTVGIGNTSSSSSSTTASIIPSASDDEDDASGEKEIYCSPEERAKLGEPKSLYRIYLHYRSHVKNMYTIAKPPSTTTNNYGGASAEQRRQQLEEMMQHLDKVKTDFQRQLDALGPPVPPVQQSASSTVLDIPLSDDDDDDDDSKQ